MLMSETNSKTLETADFIEYYVFLVILLQIYKRNMKFAAQNLNAQSSMVKSNHIFQLSIINPQLN